jgi:hypothetical protein
VEQLGHPENTMCITLDETAKSAAYCWLPDVDNLVHINPGAITPDIHSHQSQPISF